MKKIAILSVFAALLVTLTGCYGHGPLKELRSGEADKKAAEAAKVEKKAEKPAPAAKKAVKTDKTAPAKTAPAK